MGTQTEKLWEVLRKKKFYLFELINKKSHH